MELLNKYLLQHLINHLFKKKKVLINEFNLFITN